MVTYSSESRIFQRVGIIFPALILLLISVDETPVECLCIAFSDIILCREDDPFSYWLYLLFLILVTLFSIYVLIRTFRKIEPEELQEETVLLRRWTKGVIRKTGGIIDFPARSRLAAFLIVTLYVSPFIWLAIKHRTVFFPSGFQLEFGAATVVGGMLLWLPVKWLSESLTLTNEGMQYSNFLLSGRVRPWKLFKYIVLIPEGERQTQGIWLYTGWARIVINKNTIPKGIVFNLASRYIVAQIMAHNVPIHIPVSGVKDWIETSRA